MEINVYPEVSTFNFFSAMTLIAQGKKVRVVSWPENQYIGLEVEEKIRFGEKVQHFTLISSELANVNLLTIQGLLNAKFEVVE